MAENSSPNGTWVTGAGRLQASRTAATKATEAPQECGQIDGKSLLANCGRPKGVPNDRMTDRYHMAFWQIYSRDSQRLARVARYPMLARFRE